MVGKGQRFPRRVHHRGASIVSHRADGRFIGGVQGYDHWFRHAGSNPNVVGASRTTAIGSATGAATT